ncbi:5-azacytidine resistance protein azr1 [Aphelenchoides avenae]|nr:5-azacytidine resistance protein azr1 [Aphelenchus avenae]
MFASGRLPLLVRVVGPSTVKELSCGLRSVGAKKGFATVAKACPSEPASSKPLKQKVDATCCGFPKDLVGGPSTVLDSGVFGEDACFISAYKSTHVTGERPFYARNQHFITGYNAIAGVADGVGGWRKYGIDPSEFSGKLMKNCAEIVQAGDFEPARPDLIIAKAFKNLSNSPGTIGSSTACVVVVHQRTLYSANLGDSGFLVYRNGKVIYRSQEQVHYFNAPFQMALLPEEFKEMRMNFISDTPEKSEMEQIALESGDLVLVATDGLWDNVPEQVLVSALKDVNGPEKLQTTCNAIALIARRLSHDAEHPSPFVLKAGEHGLDYGRGGKPDDITLVLIYIS